MQSTTRPDFRSGFSDGLVSSCPPLVNVRVARVRLQAAHDALRTRASVVELLLDVRLKHPEARHPLLCARCGVDSHVEIDVAHSVHLYRRDRSDARPVGCCQSLEDEAPLKELCHRHSGRAVDAAEFPQILILRRHLQQCSALDDDAEDTTTCGLI